MDNPIVSYLKKCFSKENFANFKGRARRQEYWFFYLGYFIIGIIVGMIGVLIPSISQALSTLCGLVFLVPMLAVGARRLHDIGKSGWMQLIVIIPIVGWILLIVWFATEGKPEENKWGKNPKLDA